MHGWRDGNALVKSRFGLVCDGKLRILIRYCCPSVDWDSLDTLWS